MSLSSCPYCSGSVRHIERRRDMTDNGHSNGVYYCPNCDREVVSG